MPALLGPFVRCGVSAALLVLWIVFAGFTRAGEFHLIRLELVNYPKVLFCFFLTHKDACTRVKLLACVPRSRPALRRAALRSVLFTRFTSKTTSQSAFQVDHQG